MRSFLTLTEVNNIDWGKMSVIDSTKIEKTIIDWGTEVAVLAKEEEKKIPIEKISLYDHILKLNDKQYKILHMLSKP